MGTGTLVSGFRRRLIGSIVALCTALPAWAAAEEGCVENIVLLRGDWGRAQFNVEIADDPDEQARGLMHRESMPTSAGMYFINERPRRASFWMRNTLIPLDMLFIDASGVVQHIHHEAIPLDETPIPGGDGVLTVLEINGGLARRLGITIGSQVRHPAHADWDPAWPC